VTTPGRPRSPQADHDIRRATLDLLDERGYSGLSIEAVAQRAGVGKATVYRRHRSKAELVFAHLMHDLDLPPPADAGSLRADLTAILDDLIARMADPLTRQALPGLIADLRADPGLLERFKTTFVARERECLATVLDRAVARGELPTRPDLELVHALLVGPVYAGLSILDTPPPAGAAGQLAVLIAAGLTYPPAPPRPNQPPGPGKSQRSGHHDA
jgi:AcrR family transcriptional regulator